ncbi:MAG TPA: hypothetical protein PLV51_04060 [Lentimicrobium sp.]|nr:hypothetical protein [Lentimicrobium sp.]
MKTFRSFDEALHYAINSARECAEFYTRLAENARNARIQRVYQQFSREEYAQMVSLLRLQETVSDAIPARFPLSLELFNCSDGVAAITALPYARILILAMRKTRSSVILYREMASRASEKDVSEILITLSHKELTHQRAIEKEYNESLLLHL